MREIVVKNITSENKRKKDLYITEIVEKNGLKTITRRHSLYILRRHNKIGDPNELIVNQSGLEMNNKTKRHVFIFKKQDTKHKKESFICDVVGKFYAVVKDEFYSLRTRDSFVIDILALQEK